MLRRFADRGCRNGNDGDRLAGGREDLELVALENVGARRIVLDNDADVARAKAFLGKVPRQDDSLVAVSPARIIHIVRTKPVLPFGPVNGPRISYFYP